MEATLYFTFSEGCDVGSGVNVEVTTGEFDGLQAYRDMASLTEDDPAGPTGYCLQVGKHRFEVEHEIGSNWRFHVIELDGLQRVTAEILGQAGEPPPDRGLRAAAGVRP